ncbi:MAG: chorismate synthase [Lachnospiraceae bacterium]|nr:chorismate synthase [Lachnospiraceae bacterium]
MSSSYGENLRVTIFGQSHSNAIGMTLEGIPAGEKIDTEKLNAFMARRAPGNNSYSTPRKEADQPEFLCGVFNDYTCGTPISAIIRNSNTRSQDYSELKRVPRPGHADYTAEEKYKGFQDYTGGGHFSGRLTAPLCIAGGICLQILEKEGIEILTRIKSIKDVEDKGELIDATSGKTFPVVDDAQGEKMVALIEEYKAKGDSVGGIIECVINGLPVGLGDPMFDGMENRIANIIFGIPAVKGLEFGAGFDVAKMTGSENNDYYKYENGQVKTLTNNAGGILGGITNGMPLTFKVAIKPTPSIAMTQQSVDLKTGEEKELVVKGRHDPCIVPRAVPVVEAAAAIAVYDALLGQKKLK